MTENEIAKIIVDAAYHIHVKLGLPNAFAQFVIGSEIQLQRSLTAIQPWWKVREPKKEKGHSIFSGG
jgi:hypothetical protein